LPDKAIDLIDEAASMVRMADQSPPEGLKAMEERAEKLRCEKEEAVLAQDFEKAAAIRDEEKKLRQKIFMKRSDGKTGCRQAKAV
jgi:ATP-dependent Clp protease ATP-binding subunit ClpC